MSIKVMTMVWETELTPANKFVLLALADWADDEGQGIYPSLARVAWKCNYDRKTIKRNIDALMELGILNERLRPGNTNLYAIDISKLVNRPPYNKGGQNDPPTHRQNVPPPMNGMPPNPSVSIIDGLGDKANAIITAYMESFPDNARPVRTPYMEKNAVMVARAGYTPEEVSALTQQKLKAGKGAAFSWIVADIQDTRIPDGSVIEEIDFDD